LPGHFPESVFFVEVSKLQRELDGWLEGVPKFWWKTVGLEAESQLQSELQRELQRELEGWLQGVTS